MRARRMDRALGAQARAGRRIRALTGLLLALASGCGGGTPVEPKEPAPAPLPTTTEEPEATDESALLDVLSKNPTEIRIDGKSVGTTPISGHKLPPGSHDVTFVFGEGDTPTLTVTLGPGEAKTLKLDPAPPIQEQQKDDKKK